MNSGESQALSPIYEVPLDNQGSHTTMISPLPLGLDDLLQSLPVAVNSRSNARTAKGRRNSFRRWMAFLILCVGVSAEANETDSAISAALERAGENRTQLQQALDGTPEACREGMQFLIINMPDSDLQSLSAEFLREHVEYAYKAWNEATWQDRVPKEIFLDSVLPYSSIDERRDAWRKDFFERFQPLVADATTPSQAAALLNQKIFPLVNVKYSRQRPKANQSPYESIEAQVASCSGLSVLLIDACRAVGVPARFVGTPLWSDRSGNHSWVEVWDQGWHFTGAAEPNGNELDKAWFVGRASQALRDQPRHAIYATSFRKTPLTFPLVWNRRDQSVFAVNVTDRYTRQPRTLAPGRVEVMFCVFNASGHERVAAQIQVTNADNQLLLSGTTNDERFDGNDHLRVVLSAGQSYQVVISFNGAKISKTVDAQQDGQLFSFVLGE